VEFSKKQLNMRLSKLMLPYCFLYLLIISKPKCGAPGNGKIDLKKRIHKEVNTMWHL